MAGKEAGASKEPPPRPTITLPGRSSVENFFKGGSDISPGPMTLVTSFFSENDAETECRSFSQLLAGAMASPNAFHGRNTAFSSGNSGFSGENSGQDSVTVKQSRPLSLVVSPPSFLTIPPGLSPTGLLDSPVFISSAQGQFGISHQQALAQVTAQAAQSQSQLHFQAEYPPSISAPSLTHSAPPPPVNATPIQQRMPSASDGKESGEVSYSERRSHAPIVVDKPSDDGYNWRKYGQKQVKGSEYPRSYYKCTHPSCPVKKKVERNLEGHVTEIIYKGQHNHAMPQTNKRAKDGGSLVGGTSEGNGSSDAIAKSETGGYSGSLSSVNAPGPSMQRRDQEYGQGTPDNMSGSSDGEEAGGAIVKADDRHDDEPDLKRRNIADRETQVSTSHRTVTEPRIIVQTTSEVDLLDDGYRWRKYGQKVVKGNPHPRSYYKCTNVGCNVRKHVERASNDARSVITTYEGKHNHDVPAAKNSSHNTMPMGTGKISSTPLDKQATTLQSTGVSRPKEEPFSGLLTQNPGPK
ncbi:hypothetical protein AMTRI_Chr10g225790 [Amborella trichopoda]